MLPEARERAALLTDVHTEVHLDLTSTDDFLVEATITFGCTQPGASTFLELNGGSDVTLDGQPAPYADGRIALTDLGATTTVHVTARMPYVHDGNGMTETIDPADGERYLSAHTSMDITQKVIPCFDQPDIKTTFEVSVTAPSHWTVVANGALAERASGEAGDTWRFERTPPFSTYLFTVQGGPWVSVTWDEPYAPAPGGTLPFGWHARASQERELRRDADELKRITSACFQHYTTVFEPEYPYADYQQVFAPGLNWGAMEFPGCVVFRDSFLSPGTPTELEKEWVASTIAHEMAHMWFGDLVTMKWWEDSWLNESFADFMGYDVAGVAAGYTDAWTSAAITRKPTGYRADRRRSTHPIAEDTEKIVDVDTAFANFDMITYAKGNSALAQLGHWLGEDDFLAGVNKHLTAHAFGNADLADFLDSLDAATDKDVRGWAEAWLRTTGFDTLVVTRDSSGVPVLTRDGSRSHRITVSAYDDDMALVGSEDVLIGDENVRLEAFAGRVVVPSSGDETFAVIRPDEQSWAAITAGLSSVESQLTRAMLWWTAVDLTEAHVIAVADLVALADEHLRPESHPIVFEGVMRNLQLIARRYSTPSEVAGHLAVIADIARGAVEGGDPTLAPGASRVLARLSADRDFLVGWLGEDDVDPSVRWAAVHRLAELGDPSHIDVESERDKSVSGHHSALRARAAIPTAEAKEEIWARLMGGELGNHEFDAVGEGFWGWEQADLLRPYLDRYVTEGLDLARRSGQAMSDVIGDAFPRLPLTVDVRRELRAAVASALEAGDVPTVLARSWNDSLDDLDRTL
ncbi:Membrane alanyl aminopeptidase Metallo peptidase. MEROPS family M01 [Nocardioides exalbidus]|uniref:Aminopeptidase N n=1 Tax=Nocardioides exalbidus TaxID=402596 RepID=A0A1H4KF67_9ACTN|nr:aminopeptidase N [Nocardioides exalbidus]SEB57141.1 Membrane alanyl aminopeptidase Metallo peptidase. MEROPS family M01 [Nocardioides exalbidus]